ncbi:MAG: hypothetical protein OXG35_14840 [Acidobacteria bacterium]|nr:hypothetical protein [Acidobacteriota bacterium]
MKPVIRSVVLCASLCAAAQAGAQVPVGALAIDERQGDQWGWAVDYDGREAGPAQAPIGLQSVVAVRAAGGNRSAQSPATTVDDVIVRVTGRGARHPDGVRNPARARLLARRAATVDAYRRISEQVYGVTVVISRDRVRFEARGIVRGSRIVEVRHWPGGVAEVDMTLDHRELQRIINW